MNLDGMTPRHLKVATLFLASMICMVPFGCGSSKAEKQQMLNQHQTLVQQQQAAQQLLAAQQHPQPQAAAPQITPAPTLAGAAHPASTPDSHSCPDFRGQFIYPGDTPVTVQQEGCSRLLFRHQDGTTATVVLDGKAHKLQGEDGQSVMRTSAWEGTTVHIEDKVYNAGGKYIQRGIRYMGVDKQGNIILRTEMHAILDGQEVPEGNPIVNVARRIGAGAR